MVIIQVTQKSETGEVIKQETRVEKTLVNGRDPSRRRRRRSRRRRAQPEEVKVLVEEKPPEVVKTVVDTTKPEVVESRPDLQSSAADGKTFLELSQQPNFVKNQDVRAKGGRPDIFVSEEALRRTPTITAQARGEQGVGITRPSLSGQIPSSLVQREAKIPGQKELDKQPLSKDPLVQSLAITGGVAAAGTVFGPVGAATSVATGLAAPKIGEELSLVGVSRQDKKLVKSELGQQAISFGLAKSSQKVSEETSLTGVATRLKASKFQLGQIKPGLTAGTFAVEPKTPEQAEAKQEILGEVRAFAEDLTILAGDEKTYLKSVREFAKSKGVTLTKSQEKAFLKARTGRGTGQIVGAIGIGALSERLGQRYVAGTFARASGSKLAGKEIGKFTAVKAGAAIVPAGIQEGTSIYLLESKTRGFKPTVSGAVTSGLAGGATAGVAGGIIAGGAVATGKLKPIGKATDVVLNVLDPYEKAGDITYDIAASQFSRRFRTPVLTPTVTKQADTFSLGATAQVVGTPGKSGPVFVQSTKSKVPVEIRTKADVKSDVSILPDSPTKIQPVVESPVKIDPIVSVPVQAQVPVQPFVPVQPLSKTFVPVQPLIKTQTKTQTQVNIPVTTFDKAPAFPFIPFGGGRGRRGTKGKKPKITGEAETLYRIFTGRAKQKKGLFGASAFRL